MADQEPLSLSPSDLRALSTRLGDVSSDLWGVISSLTEALAEQGDPDDAPWGKDDIGNQFSQGDSGYLAQKQNVYTSVKDKTDLLNGWALSLKQTADSLQAQDQQGT